MKQKLFSLFLVVIGLIVGTIVSQAATFYDFEMDLRDANGGILTADEVSAATTTSLVFLWQKVAQSLVPLWMTQKR